MNWPTLLLMPFLALPVIAQTNRHYVTLEPRASVADWAGPPPEQIEKSRTAPESRPAEADPEGNWGKVAEGFQLSIRLAKESFTNGEPVIATILLRNVSDQPLTYFVCSGEDPDGPLLLETDNHRVPRKNEAKPGASFEERLRAIYAGSRYYRQCPVGAQQRFQIELGQRFALTNGEYHVQAQRAVRALDQTNQAQVVSAKATFTITGPDHHPEK